MSSLYATVRESVNDVCVCWRIWGVLVCMLSVLIHSSILGQGIVEGDPSTSFIVFTLPDHM